jgi:hypothetical protein
MILIVKTKKNLFMGLETQTDVLENGNADSTEEDNLEIDG